LTEREEGKIRGRASEEDEVKEYGKDFKEERKER
jgi:hypothetical protein